jgi:pimeloyl-ACP methyl ester carboxylesterase
VATYASRNPKNVDKMVFIAPLVDPLNELAKPIVRSWIGTAFVKSQLRKQIEGDIRKTLAKHGLPDRYADLFVGQATIKGFQRSIISFFKNAAGVDYRPYYHTTGESVHDIMLVWGDKDKTVRTDQVKQFELAIPSARVEILKNVGHLAPFEATERLNDLLVSFLSK